MLAGSGVETGACGFDCALHGIRLHYCTVQFQKPPDEPLITCAGHGSGRGAEASH